MTQRDLGFPLLAFSSSPAADAIEEELKARRWSPEYLACRMGGATPDDRGKDLLTLQMLFALRQERNVLLGADFDAKLARAFDVTPGFFLALHDTWRLPT